MTISRLKINGTVVPTPAPEGVSITKERRWSGDKGQTASGRTVGTLLGTKYRIAVEWPHLTPAQVSIIETAIGSGAFHTVELTGLAGETVSISAEIESTSGTWFRWVPGLQYVTGYAMTIIER